MIQTLLREHPFQQAHLCVKRNLNVFTGSSPNACNSLLPSVEHCNKIFTFLSPYT